MPQAVLMVAAYLCSLVAGLLFSFAVVVMPGIRSLDDGGFIRAFQTIDRTIQNNQPLFVFVWVGSVLAVIFAAVSGIWVLTGVDRLLMIVAALVYLLGVQAPLFVRPPTAWEQEVRSALESMECDQSRVRQRGVRSLAASPSQSVTPGIFRRSVRCYRLGSDRGSPNHGSTLLSKRVMAEIRSPVRVRT